MYSLRWESLKFRFKPSTVKWGHILHKLAKAKSPTDGKQNPNFEVTPPSKLLTVNTVNTVNCLHCLHWFQCLQCLQCFHCCHCFHGLCCLDCLYCLDCYHCLYCFHRFCCLHSFHFFTAQTVFTQWHTCLHILPHVYSAQLIWLYGFMGFGAKSCVMDGWSVWNWISLRLLENLAVL